MSRLEINTDGTKGKLFDVTFGFVKLQSGAFKYQSDTELEYTIDCVVDKTTAKAYKKAFPKNGYKEVETKEFKNIYKVAAPFPEEDEQYIIKLKSNANLKKDIPKAGLVAGDLIPYEWKTRPKVFVPVDGGVKDITMSVLVSNGSTGDVSFNINTYDGFGTFPQLSGILVKNLIEYIPKTSVSDFGEVVGGYNAGDGNPQQIPTVNDEEDVDDTFNDDSIPF